MSFMTLTLATIGLIVLLVCGMLAFAFFIAGIIDELSVDDTVSDAGARFARRIKNLFVRRD